MAARSPETAAREAPAPAAPRSARPAARQPAEAAPRVRDAAATRKRILEAAIDEFAERGFSGARIDSIAQRSSANMRMIYHYYGNKEDLYVYVLDHVYEDIRRREASLNLSDLGPFEAMMKLFDFTFSHFEANPHVIALWTGENLQKGLYLSTAPRAAKLSSPLVDAIRETLKRGEAAAVFRAGIDPLQLYVSMVALSYFHLSNAYTLSAVFQTDLQSEAWRAERRAHAGAMIAAYLRPAD
ncbi:MAG: TetR/AcrR family transcriptional regulator [Sphingomonas fennica]